MLPKCKLPNLHLIDSKKVYIFVSIKDLVEVCKALKKRGGEIS